MIKVLNSIKYLIILFALIFLLSGCWDFRDVNDRTISISVGVDKANGDIEYSGENASLVPSNKSGEKGQASNVSGVYFYSGTFGKDFEDTRLSYNTSIPEPDFLGAVRVVVFSQEFAAEGIEQYANRINRLFGYRKSLPFLVSREPPRDLFSKNVKNSIAVGFAIEITMEHLEKEGSAFYPKTVNIISDIAMREIGYVLPYIGKKNDSIEFLGYAVMKDSKMIDIISLRESNGLLYLLVKKPAVIEAFPHPSNNKNNISAKTTLRKRKIKTSYINNNINISIDLKMDTQIQYLYYVGPLSNKDIELLEQAISNKIKNEITSLIYKTKKDYELDIFGFARYFRAQNPQIYKNMKWSSVYPNANIVVNTSVKILNTNLLDPNARYAKKRD